MPVVVAQPPEGISTADVFRALRVPSERISSDRAVNASKRGLVAPIAGSLFNRLEGSATGLSEWPSRLRQEFDKLPCLGHQMSGSGSCYFGLFASHLAATISARILRQRIPGAIICEYRTTRGIAFC
jgi:4-diphosphocytidyl-2-C-methyl-D-erythritol kinase